jgi:hypothetical protein
MLHPRGALSVSMVIDMLKMLPQDAEVPFSLQSDNLYDRVVFFLEAKHLRVASERVRDMHQAMHYVLTFPQKITITPLRGESDEEDTPF